jgi:hypothetical protein
MTLTNNSQTTAVRITYVDTSAIGQFTTDATQMVGQTIPPGGSLTIHFTAPPLPTVSPSLTAVTATVIIHTDSDTSSNGTTLTLTEEPHGAVLQFGTSATPGCTTSSDLGNFGSAGLLLQQGPSQNFCVTNSGNAPAKVVLMAAQDTSDDDGGLADSGIDGSLMADADVDGGILSPYSLLVSSFSLPAATSSTTPGVEQDSITFQPLRQGATNGLLSVSTTPETVLCGTLPDAIPLAGTAIGGGPSVQPASLSFPATCGGGAPPSQTFVVSNSSQTTNMNWTLSALEGPGAHQYTVSANPAPGLLTPNTSSIVTVTAAAVPSPVVDPSPASLAAQVTVTTDVPFDPPHVVALSEEPLGDQLFVTSPDQAGNLLRFGQLPLATAFTRSFTLTNAANPNSPAANVSIAISGAGAAAYSPATQSSAPAAGASVAVPVTFNAASAISYPATVAFTTNDALCTPLPSPLTLQGTGTAGALTLSASTLYFGTNPNATDVTQRALVPCGSTGTAQTLTITNSGNQSLTLTGVTLAGGTSSPFSLSGPATAGPTLAIGGSTTVTITPTKIPATGVDPNSAAYNDNLTIATNVPGSLGSAVQLLMQPQGAVISGTAPPATWNFGTVAEGSIGTYQGTLIQNTGNLAATVTLQAVSPLTLPSVFGLQGNPVTVPANGQASLVGQFAPNLGNGSWSGQGELVVSASAFCNPLPAAWTSPQIAMSGTSTSSPIVTLSGNLAFAATNCGAAVPGGQSVTLTNLTNQAYTYTLSLSSGAHYLPSDGGAGALAANGTSTIVLNPVPVIPGAGVHAGILGDELTVTVDTVPPTVLTAPISWTLSGAVLSLVNGAGPFGSQGSNFYVADSTSGFPLSIQNTGTAGAMVDFAIQPAGLFSFTPTPPVQVLPGIPALPELVSGSSAPMCQTTSNGSATFTYSGPVCQPLQLPSVHVDACSGTYAGQMNPPPPPPPVDAGSDASSVDAGSDAGTADAGAPTACTSAPCAATGTNSVQCHGNANGVCTPTEALIVAHDIDAGLIHGEDAGANAGQLLGASCYGCLNTFNCLDNAFTGPSQGTPEECGDLTTFTPTFVPTGTSAGKTAEQACLDVIACTFANKCATGNPDLTCYCGTFQGPSCNTMQNGPCQVVEANGIGVAPTDGTDVQVDYTETSLSSGMANTLFACAFSNGCQACLQ